MQGKEIESQAGEAQSFRHEKTDRHTEHGRYRRSGRNGKTSGNIQGIGQTEIKPTNGNEITYS